MMLAGGEPDPLGRLMAQMSGGGAAPGPPTTSGGAAPRREAVPQWGAEETREFIAVRAELERDFAASRRSRTLWEAVAARMRERGYRRSPEQCKCKWKNLVNRYKGKETSDPDTGRQCPFFDELHAVFTERARTMQRLLLESESGTSHQKKKSKRFSGNKSSEEFSEGDNEEGDDSEDEPPNKSKRRKTDKDTKQAQYPVENKPPSRASDSIHSILQDFFHMQQHLEMQWRETLERRAQERRLFEHEWRQTMEKLERERLMLEQAWREREEQRRMREETRAEKRDALLTTLLTKLLQEDF